MLELDFAFKIVSTFAPNQYVIDAMNRSTFNQRMIDQDAVSF